MLCKRSAKAWDFAPLKPVFLLRKIIYQDKFYSVEWGTDEEEEFWALPTQEEGKKRLENSKERKLSKEYHL